MLGITELTYTALISFLIVVILGPIFIPMLTKFKFGQTVRDDGPKTHLAKNGTPTMGGILMIVAILITGLTRSKVGPDMVIGLICIFGFGLIGFIDDFIIIKKRRSLGLKAWQKMVLQIIAAVAYVFLLVEFGGIDTTLHIPFINKAPVDLGIVYYLFAVILIVGVVNSVNLTDGLDGLASSITLIVAAFFATVLFTVKTPILENDGVRASLSFVSSALIGAMIGFLIFNHYPAKVFMGDTGSLFLGGMVVGAAFIIDEPLIIVIAGGVYIFEAISVMLQVSIFKITKKITGKEEGYRLFKCSPIHHHFQESGWSEVHVVVVFVLVTVILCGVAWLGLYFG